MKKLIVLPLVFVLSLLGVSCKAQSKNYFSFVQSSLSVPPISFSQMKKNTSILAQKDTITPAVQPQPHPVSIVIIRYTVLSISDMRQIQYRLEKSLRENNEMDPMILSFEYRPFDSF